MKNSYLLYAFAIAASILFMSHFGGSEGGYSGSPGDGKTCGTNGGCHNTTASAQEMIFTDISGTKYSPGDTVAITLTATRSGVSRFGFEFRVEDSSNQAIGELIGNSRVTTVTFSGERATHKAQSAAGSNDSITWNFDWVTPAKGSGDAHMYVAVNATNGNGGKGGDKVLIDDLLFTEGTPISTRNLIPELGLYPNPATDVLYIKTLQGKQFSGEVLTLQGKSMLAFKDSNKLNIADLPKGRYFLMLEDATSVYRLTFLKL